MSKIRTIKLKFWVPFSIFSGFTLLLVLFTLQQYNDFRTFIETRTVAQIKERHTRVGHRIEQYFSKNHYELIDDEISDLNISGDVQAIVLLDDKGTILNGSQLEWNGQPVQKHLPSFDTAAWKSVQHTNIQEIHLSEDGYHIYVYEPIIQAAHPGELRSQKIGVLYTEYDLTNLRNNQLIVLILRAIYLWAAGLVLMAILLIALRHWMSRPLKYLQMTINQFGSGKQDARLEISGNGELAELAEAYNRMAEEVLSQGNKVQEALKTANREINMRKEIEAELQKAKDKAEESDKLKSAFLANMSHEIRTPMNGIIGFTELLKEKDLSENERDKFVSIIHKSSHQLLDIISDIIDISKIEAGQMTVASEIAGLNQLAEELMLFFQPQAEKRNLKLSFQKNLSDRDSFVYCDPAKLRQILVNLLGNALKFTSSGSVGLSFRREEQNLVFRVADTGIGIASGLHKVIFDRFRQAESTPSPRSGGTGLGLAITKSFVEMMGGTIWVESEPGKGSTFSFTIPYIPVESAIASPIGPVPESYNESHIWSGKTLLLVEDIEDNALLIRHALKSTGIKLLLAGNGREALEIQAEHPEISLILMDMKMPEIDGYEATRKFKSKGVRIPVIATTAFALAGDREKCLAAGCDDYLAKPILRDKLFVILEKYLPKS